MQRVILVVLIVLGMGLMGCADDTAIVTSANTVSLVGTGTENPGTETLDLGAMNSPNKLLVSPNGRKSYICRAKWGESADGDTDTDVINVVDLANGVIEGSFTTQEHLQPPDNEPTTRLIWDMQLSRDGSRLVVGTCGGNEGGRIEVYDTTDNSLVGYYQLPYQEVGPLNTYWGYRSGYSIVLHPTKDIVYAIVSNGPQGWWADSRVSALSFEGLASGSVMTELSGFRIALSNVFFDFGDFSIKMAPEGDLLVAVSSGIYPFKVEADGSLTKLYGGDGRLVVENPNGDDSDLLGRTDVLFTQDKQQLYVNWSGLDLGLLRLNGGSVCLDNEKLLAGDADPFLFTWLDFFQDVIPDLVRSLLSDDFDWIADLLDSGMYGVAVSTIVDNTVFMVIAPLVDANSILEAGGVLLVVFETNMFGAQAFRASKILDFYPTDISVNPDNNQLILAQNGKDIDDADGDGNTNEIIHRLMVLDKHPLGWYWADRRFILLDNKSLALGLTTVRPF